MTGGLSLTAATVALAVLMSGCDGERVGVYRTDFDQGSGIRWFTYAAEEPIGCKPLSAGTDEDRKTYAASSAPWWVDRNHAPPGLGWLNLIAFAYHRDFLSEGEIDAPYSGRPLDLRHAEVSLRWRAPTLRMPRDARMLFWFQTRISPPDKAWRFVNYVVMTQPLVPHADSSEWIESKLTLRVNEADYRCLGSSDRRIETYGCEVQAVEALRDWNTDLGIVILLADESQSWQVKGSVELSSLSIWVPKANLETHAQAPVSIIPTKKTPDYQ